VRKTRPDLAVVDIHTATPGRRQRAGGARPPRRPPDLGIMLLSQHRDRATLDLIASGGFGYLLKDRVFDVDEFLDALRRVAGVARRSIPRSSRVIGHQRRADPLASSRPRAGCWRSWPGRTSRGVARRLFSPSARWGRTSPGS
jgi:DNA-binding NarL/FixJ family response regulator